MRFTITPLGSAGGRTVGQVVDDIVRYLEPRIPERSGTAPTVPSGEGPSSYYSDRGSEAGRWRGYGAHEAGLDGPVYPADFARVLAGRDPLTGVRLITAQGSAGRRASLGAGNATRTGPSGEALYGIDDVAAALKITKSEAQALVAAGQRQALSTFARVGGGALSVAGEPEGSYLVPRIDPDDARWVTETELDRCEQARTVGVSPAQIAAGGDPTDQLSVPEAARLAGVTSRYLRSLCRRWEDHRTEIEASLVDGKTPERAHVVAHRGTRGQWIVTRGELGAFLERRTAPAVRVGYDLTLTTEKSLGVLALLCGDATRRAVLDAIEAGNDTGIAYLELHAGAARAKDKPVLVRGLTVASFRHLTSRALDPFPHHHNVIANTVVDEHGDRRALDARGLYTHAQAASALATAQMRHDLTRSVGVRWRRGWSGSWEIDGIGDDVLREFSRRRSEIEDAVAELEKEIGRRSTLDEVQAIIASTRPAKKHVDASQLVAGWWERARRLGLTPNDLARCTGRRPPNTADLDRAALFQRLASPTGGVCANTSIFTRSDVLCALCDIDVGGGGGDPQPLLLPAVEIENLADEFLASELVIQLDPSGVASTSALSREELFTTAEILGVQRQILEQHREGVASGAGVVGAEHLAQALADHPALVSEQRALVASFCTSGDQLQCGIGRAGAGKTTTMRAAAQAWASAGFTVVGAAVKGEATRHLAEGAGIPAETIAWYLARKDNPLLGERTVLIIDEASTLSDRDLSAVLSIARRTGATVRLIGDPDQHGAVAAGGMFRHLCETSPDRTPELSTTHRILDPGDRVAASLLRAGHASEALARLEEGGHLHVAGDEIELYLGMLRNWWDGHQQGQHHPMVDRRHHTRHQLNRLARQLLRTNGELGDIEIASSRERSFAVGDRVVARMVGRHLHPQGQRAAYVRNGAVGIVTAVERGADTKADRLTVAFDGIGAIEIPRAFFDEHAGPGGRADVGIDHAYAVTSYSVQGATFDVSTSRIDEGASRAETYVDITRGRHANHLFVTRAADPLDGEHLPKAPARALQDSIAGRLRRSGPERAAIEFPAAPRSSAAGRFASRQPPTAWRSRLPEPTGSACHLRRRWFETLEAVLTYRNRWTPTSGHGTWEWAIGSSPTDRDAAAERSAVIELLGGLAAAFAREHLAAGGLDTRWAIDALATAISRGTPQGELAPVADLCQAVAEYRQTVGLDDSEVPNDGLAIIDLLGPEPSDPVMCMEHRRLARELAARPSPHGVSEIAMT